MWLLLFIALVLQLSDVVLAGNNTRQNSQEPPKVYYHFSTYVDGSVPDITPTIHGGQYAPELTFPYMVFLLVLHHNGTRLQPTVCSGSITHPEWVLTAAHCAWIDSNFVKIERMPHFIAVAGKADIRKYYTARIKTPVHEYINEGSYGVQERMAIQVHLHPEFKSLKGGHDMCLLYLNRPFNLNAAVKTLPLSRKKFVRESCTIHGWGKNEFEKFEFILTYFSPIVGSTPESYCKFNKKGPFICLERNGGGICSGDSGSPLVCRGEIWGVASFIASEKPNPDCSKGEEDYFTPVYQHLDWMDTVMTSSGRSLSGVKTVKFLVALIWLFVQ